MRCAFLGALAALALVPATRAGAHEVLHEVQRGRAVAVRAYFADGEVMAYAAYEVYAPSDPRIPWAKGRTDRAGWLAFVPDAPGTWRVKVADATGHGLDLEVDGGASAGESSPMPAAAFVARPLLGVALIAALFAVLWAVQRRRARGP